LFPAFQPFQTQRLLCEAPWGGGEATKASRAEPLRLHGDLADHVALINQPIYITHGEDDELVRPSAARRLYDGVASTDKTLGGATATEQEGS
jgi:esterase/lipase